MTLSWCMMAGLSDLVTRLASFNHILWFTAHTIWHAPSRVVENPPGSPSKSLKSFGRSLHTKEQGILITWRRSPLAFLLMKTGNLATGGCGRPLSSFSSSLLSSPALSSDVGWSRGRMMHSRLKSAFQRHSSTASVAIPVVLGATSTWLSTAHVTASSWRETWKASDDDGITWQNPITTYQAPKAIHEHVWIATTTSHVSWSINPRILLSCGKYMKPTESERTVQNMDRYNRTGLYLYATLIVPFVQ